MSKQSHTPGPWGIFFEEPRENWSDGYARIESSRKHELIAVVKQKSGYSDTSGIVHNFDMPLESNARLIAAAPCLLVALHRAGNVIQTLTKHDAELAQKYADCLAQINEALSKARGQ